MALVSQNEKFLKVIHFSVGALIIAIFATFFTWTGICTVTRCFFSESNSLLLTTGVLNYFVGLLLTLSTVMLIVLWRD